MPQNGSRNGPQLGIQSRGDGAGKSAATVVVACFDAGAAEILTSLVAHNSYAVDWHLLTGRDAPAWKIAVRKGLGDLLVDIDEIATLDTHLCALSPDLVLFGTGWQRQLQEDLFDYSKANAIPTVGFLDHWTGYRERFGYPEPNWRLRLPDFIAMGDPTALAIAERVGLPNVVGVRNLYFADICAEAQRIEQDRPRASRLLFLSEPTAKAAEARFGEPTYWGFTEGDVFRDVLDHAHALGVEEIEVRLHPSDEPDVYAALARQRPDVPCRISASEAAPLVVPLMEAAVVVGVDSYALYVAHELGVPTVSIVPNERRECTVPLPDANRARTLRDVSVDDLQRPSRVCADAGFGMDFASLMELVARASSAHEGGA